MIKSILLTLFLASPLFSVSQSLQQKLNSAFLNFEKDSQLQYSLTSFTVLNAESGEVIFADHENMGLASASTLKTITSASAYYLLGRDFKWETALGYSGTITPDGTLKGDLILKGTGDPTLGSERFNQTKPDVLLKRWMDAVRKAGIKRVDGKVVADDRLLGTQTVPLGWIWQDMGNYYGAGISAVNWNENQFDLVFQPGVSPGDPVKLVRTQPAVSSYLKIMNEVTTGRPGTGDNVYAYSAPFSDVIYLRGTYAIDLKKNISASLPDPAFEAAYRLTQALQQANITIKDAASTNRYLIANNQNPVNLDKVIDIYNSPSIDSVVYWLNKKSINLYAESFIKAIALKYGKDVSTAEGVEVLKGFWEKKLNIDENSINILDGSGLSPENRITTLSMANILYSVQKEPWFAAFYNSLPIYNGIAMKSGTIRNGLAYCGYHTTTWGTKVVFSIIVNNYNGSTSAMRQKMFRLLDELK